ncbi:MAG: type II CRISPR-associated endonuclease Cas1 [Planctomycetaceae bacterium]|jgi:CRISPR-associated protein Cas1|nr:type II CRISPR-associated endonuclease Cas1 [Planctomycetaceae bacterium]
MLHRILDFSQNPLRLRTRLKQLVVMPENAPVETIPLEDIAVLLVSHPQVSFSQAVLEGIAENGAVLIACNRKSLPVGMFVPLAGHHQPSRRLSLQIGAALPLLKKAWQSVVKAKITAQGNLLQQLFGKNFGLLPMVQKVKSGDPNNMEAQAAKRYWSKLFDGFNFHRKPDGDDLINLRLNFGYGVLRGIVARAVCAGGFHPAIGLHHHNQYNPYCLADDLMEPFRPLVDRIVYEQINVSNKSPKTETPLAKDERNEEGLTVETKTELIKPLLGKFAMCGETQTIFEAVTHIAASLVQFFAKERKELLLPDSFEVIEEEMPF